MWKRSTPPCFRFEYRLQLFVQRIYRLICLSQRLIQSYHFEAKHVVLHNQGTVFGIRRLDILVGYRLLGIWVDWMRYPGLDAARYRFRRKLAVIESLLSSVSWPWFARMRLPAMIRTDRKLRRKYKKMTPTCGQSTSCASTNFLARFELSRSFSSIKYSMKTPGMSNI